MSPRALESPWFDTLANLQRNVLALSQAEVKGVLGRDIGQSYHRVRYTTQGSETGGVPLAMCCQMPAQVIWLDQPGRQERLMLGREALLFQGYPTAKIPNVMKRNTESTMGGIGGDMFATPIVLAIVQSLFASLDWHPVSLRQAQTSSQADVESALSAFALSSGSSSGQREQEADAENMPRRKLRRRK